MSSMCDPICSQRERCGTMILVDEDTRDSTLQRVLHWAEDDRDLIDYRHEVTQSYIWIPSSVATRDHGDLILREGAEPVELGVDQLVTISVLDPTQVDGINVNTGIEYDMAIADFGPRGEPTEHTARIAWEYSGNLEERTEPVGWILRWRPKAPEGECAYKWQERRLEGWERVTDVGGLMPDTDYEFSLQGIAQPGSPPVLTPATEPITLRTAPVGSDDGDGDGDGGDGDEPTVEATADTSDPTGRTARLTWKGFPDGPLRIAWGDGSEEEAQGPSGSATHQYGEDVTGERTITVASADDDSATASTTFTPGGNGDGSGGPQVEAGKDPSDPSGRTVRLRIDNTGTGDGDGGDGMACCEDNAAAIQALEQRVQALEDADGDGGDGGGITRDDVFQLLAENYPSFYVDDSQAGDDVPDVEITGAEYAPVEPEMAGELTVPPSQKIAVYTFLHGRGNQAGRQVYQSVAVEHGGQQILEPLDARGVTLAVDQPDEASSSSTMFVVNFADLNVAAGETVRFVTQNRVEGEAVGTIIDRSLGAASLPG